MDKQQLPGIVSLGWMATSTLPDDVVSQAVSGIPPTITSHTKVEFRGKAECQTEENFDNESSLDRATLRFGTVETIPTLSVAFVITTVGGASYLVGSKERPCVVKRDHATGLPGGEPSVNTYTATFEAKKALIPCNIA